MKKSTAVLTRISLMLSLSIVLSYAEYLLNLNVGIPGVKLGTANIVCLFALYRFSAAEALAVHLGRIALSALLFGTPVSLLYSITGGILAFVAMYLFKKIKAFGIIGVSVGGSAFHCIGQLCAAMVLTGSKTVFSYLPPMLVLATFFGIVTGSICAVALNRIKNK